MAACNSLFAIGRGDEGKRLLSCGNWFQRFNFPCGTHKLVPFPCDSCLCPDCANRRARPLRKKLLRHIEQGQHDYWHLTITVENWQTLTKKSLSGLIANLAELRETKVWKEEVLGGVYSLEATFNVEKQTWHPHFHLLMETNKKLPMNWIFRVREAWRHITGSHVMHLEKMYGTDKNGRRTRKVNARSLNEIVKYATKAASFADLPNRVGEFLDAFHGVRRLQSFGTFLGAQKAAEKEKADETAPDAHVGCSCGGCVWGMATPAGRVHMSQTMLLADGTRQLRLFDAGVDLPPPLPAQDWLSEKEHDARIAAGLEADQLNFFEAA